MTPSHPPIPHSRPSRSPGDLEVLARVLESGQLSAGPEVRALEEEVARSCNRRWAVATSNGLAAIHLALLILKAGPGRGVAIPSYVCTALLNAIRYVGAEEVLVDSGEGSFNMDPASRMLEDAAIVVVPHLFGFPAPMEEISRKTPARIIEDCAMAAGAEVGERPAGGAGDLAVFSFYATKMVSSGQGGLLLGDDPEFEVEARDLINYDNRRYYRIRFNYQLTEIQAALGRLQWNQLSGFVERRRALAARYNRSIDFSAIARLGGKGSQPEERSPGMSCYYRYPVDLGSPAIRDRLREILAREGIEAKSPVYRPLHRYLNFPDRDFPRSSRLQDGILSIPIYPSLTDAEADRVAEVFNRAIMEI